MISKELKYVNGHFYDIETKKRTDLKDGIVVTIHSEEKNFIMVKPAGHKPKKVLTAEEKKNKIGSDKKVKYKKSIFNAGTILYFYIPIKDAWFEAVLLEDLYMYINRTAKKDDGKLYGCACVVKSNINNRIPYFEEIYATSLNELYKSTYVHYFGNFGNPACNALDRFFKEVRNDKTKMKEYRFFSKKDKESGGNESEA